MNAATIAAFIVSLIIQVGYPLAAMILFRRRMRVPWLVFGYGALIFGLFQLLTWLPLNFYLDVVVGDRLTTETAAFIWLLAMAFGTSLMEEGGRWLGYRFLFARKRYPLTWRNGVAYGLGHNALESMLFISGLTVIYLVAYIALSRVDLTQTAQTFGPNAPDLQRTLLNIAHTTWDQPLLVALERVLALPHQVAWSLLVMASLAFRQKRWFGFSVLYHASIAVIVPGLARLAGFGWAELANAVFSGLSLWIIVRLYGVSERCPPISDRVHCIRCTSNMRRNPIPPP